MLVGYYILYIYKYKIQPFLLRTPYDPVRSYWCLYMAQFTNFKKQKIVTLDDIYYVKNKRLLPNLTLIAFIYTRPILVQPGEIFFEIYWLLSKSYWMLLVHPKRQGWKQDFDWFD